MTAGRLPFKISVIIVTGGLSILAIMGGAGLFVPDQILLGTGLSLLILAAMAIAVAARCTRFLEVVRSITRQVNHFDKDQQMGLIMVDDNDELARLSVALNRYFSRLHVNFSQVQYHLRELNIQAEVSEAEKRQAEAVFYSIAEAVIVVDPHNELLLANPAAEEIFDFSQELNYRFPIEQVLKDKDMIALLEQVQKERSSNVALTLERQHPITNKKMTLKIMASCVLNDAGQSVGVVVIIHDVTAELELSRMKDDIINAVSHDLRTPLSSIRAYAEMLANDEIKSPQTARKFCEIIHSQSLLLTRMIDDILNISKIEAGRCRENKQWLNIMALFDDVISMMDPQLKDKAIGTAVDVREPDVRVYADRDMLFQVIANLVGNAIKYSPGETCITLRGFQAGDHTVLEVEDQGYGIPADQQQLIFEKFYRVPGHSQLAGGTGLGLNLVRQVVETVHEGTVSVRSEPGRGSCFTVSLPAMAEMTLMS